MNGSTAPLSERALAQQGYTGYSAGELARISWGLRFTPSVCMAGCLVGLAMQAPTIHFVLAALGILPFFAPAHHPLDLIYNHGLRHLFRAPPIPPNPIQRRVACLLGGMMNVAIGVSFLAGMLPLAYAIGAALIALQVVVMTSHFCLASWIYERLFRSVGAKKDWISGLEARRLVRDGALLIDVRPPQVYAQRHIPGAVNMPVEDVTCRAAQLVADPRPVVLYCTAGVACGRAARALKDAGHRSVHQLGVIQRWDED